jgi:hypothetical protein
MSQLKMDRMAAEARADRLVDLLEENGIDVPEEEEIEGHEFSEEEDEDALAQPLTTLRTSSLLTGKLPEETVPRFNDNAEGFALRDEDPAYGSHEAQG